MKTGVRSQNPQARSLAVTMQLGGKWLRRPFLRKARSAARADPTWICKRRTTKSLRKKIEQTLPSQLHGCGLVREPAKSFEQLIVGQRAHQFVRAAYRAAEKFPRHEIYGLSSQLRRAAVSVPAHIAEGFKKRGQPDKVRFLNIAQASLEECRYYLILAKDLNYGDTTQLYQQIEEVSRMLGAYAAKILTSDS